MARISENIVEFDDMIGSVAVLITLQKRNEILSSNFNNESQNFVKFLKNSNYEVDKKFLKKIENAPQHLKGVIQMAAKDAAMIVSACISGIINL